MPLPVEFLLIDALRHLDAFSVPGIGSFSRTYVPAKIQTALQVIDPPRETIVFSEEISPAGLRAFEQFLSRAGNPASGISYASDEIGKEMNRVLVAKGKYVLGNLGSLVNGPTGLVVQWEEGLHHKIYSDLFGFKAVKLPEVKSLPMSEPEPVVEPVPIDKKSGESPSEPSTEDTANQKENLPNEEGRVGEKETPGLSSEKELSEKGKKEKSLKKKKKTSPFFWVAATLLLLGVGALGVWGLLNQEKVESSELAVPQESPSPSASAPMTESPSENASEIKAEESSASNLNSATEPSKDTPAIASTNTKSYYLIVFSSKSEQEIQSRAKSWSSQGLATEVLPPDETSEFYRLSVLHTSNRSEAVRKMVELKDDTYSWIFEHP
jgi:hypothetical protein